MKLTRTRLHLTVDGRSVTIPGELLVPMVGQPDFVVFSFMMKDWDDGGAVSDADRQRILDQIQREAADQGVRVAVD